jgi:hypothetical protein
MGAADFDAQGWRAALREVEVQAREKVDGSLGERKLPIVISPRSFAWSSWPPMAIGRAGTHSP